MLIDSINNLVNAKKVVVSGSIDFMPYSNYKFLYQMLGLEDTPEIDSFTLNFDSKREGISQQNGATLKVNFADETSVDLISFSNVVLENGVFYLRVEGIEKIWQDYVRDIFYNYAERVNHSLLDSHCVLVPPSSPDITSDDADDYIDDPEVEDYESNKDDDRECIYDETAIQFVVDQYHLVNLIEETINEIEGQWFEFDIKAMMDSNYVKNILQISENIRQQIVDSYDCTFDTIKNAPLKYGAELADLYGEHPFIELNKKSYGYYDLSFDADRLTDYLNSIPALQIYHETTKCTSTDDLLTTDETPILKAEPENTQKFLDQYIPRIAVRFGGNLFNRTLANLEIEGHNYSPNSSYYFTANLSFDYPSDDSQISAPQDIWPIMDFVELVDDRITLKKY